jgi:putative oxidoreductase
MGSANWHRLALHGGRGGVGLFFLLAGVSKIMTPSVPIELMNKVGMAPVWFFLPATIAVEIVCGAAVMLGARYAHSAALILALFTLATNFLFHRFWQLDGAVAQLEFSLFFKNVAIAFALLLIAAVVQQRSVKSDRDGLT